MNEAQSLLHFLKATVGLPYEPVIAGGYARDRILGVKPRDIDVFLLNAEGKYLDVSARLRAEKIVHVVEQKVYKHPSGETNPFSPAVNFDFLGWPVQIIATPSDTILNVLRTFDYNICRFWLDDKFEPRPCVKDDFDDLVHRRMRLQHLRTPWSSLRRGILMADRFDFEFYPNDRHRLIEALHQEQSS